MFFFIFAAKYKDKSLSNVVPLNIKIAYTSLSDMSNTSILFSSSRSSACSPCLPRQLVQVVPIRWTCPDARQRGGQEGDAVRGLAPGWKCTLLTQQLRCFYYYYTIIITIPWGTGAFHRELEEGTEMMIYYILLYMRLVRVFFNLHSRIVNRMVYINIWPDEVLYYSRWRFCWTTAGVLIAVQ